MIKTKQGNSDQRLNYAQRDCSQCSEISAFEVRRRKEKKITFSELSVTVKVCGCRVILLCIGGKVMDTYVAVEGGPLRNHPQCCTFYLLERMLYISS